MVTINYMLCWLNYSNNHVENILIAVKNIEHLFCMISELLSDLILDLLFLLSDGSQVNEYKLLYLPGWFTNCPVKSKQSIECLLFLMNQLFSCV